MNPIAPNHFPQIDAIDLMLFLRSVHDSVRYLRRYAAHVPNAKALEAELRQLNNDLAHARIARAAEFEVGDGD